MRKHFLSLGFAGILCLMSVGCKEGGDGVVAVKQDDLIGRWNFTSIHMKSEYSVTINGKTETFKEDTTESLAGEGNFAQFNQDLTCSADIPWQALGMGKRSAAALAVTGTWSVTGNTITVVPSNEMDTVALAAVVSGNSGTFTIVNDMSFNEGEGQYYQTRVTSEIKATKATPE